MIEKNPHASSGSETVLTHDKALAIFQSAVANALDESRRKGVPIPVEIDGKTKYELPDGTIVDSDPWLGKNTSPDGWYERWGITPPQ